MNEEEVQLLKTIDRSIDILKKKMLKGDFIINKKSLAIVRMLKIQINEIDSIARLVKQDECERNNQ